MLLTVQHFIVQVKDVIDNELPNGFQELEEMEPKRETRVSEAGTFKTKPNPLIKSAGGTFTTACALPAHLLGAAASTATPGVELLHTGTGYAPAVSCKKCKASNAYREATEGAAGLGRAEDYLENAVAAAL